MTHICVSKLKITGSDNGLSPGWCQAIIWTNAGILLIQTWGTNFSEILSEIHAFSFKKMHLKMSSAKWRPFCLGLNVLNSFTYMIAHFIYLLWFKGKYKNCDLTFFRFINLWKKNQFLKEIWILLCHWLFWLKKLIKLMQYGIQRSW